MTVKRVRQQQKRKKMQKKKQKVVLQAVDMSLPNPEKQLAVALSEAVGLNYNERIYDMDITRLENDLCDALDEMEEGVLKEAQQAIQEICNQHSKRTAMQFFEGDVDCVVVPSYEDTALINLP